MSNTEADQQISWGQWAKEMLGKGNPDAVIRTANHGRAMDTLDRNQRRVEKMANAYSPVDLESEEGDEMGVQFGDRPNPQPIIINGQGSDTLKTLATLSLGGLLGAGGLAAGYLLNKAPDVVEKIEQNAGERVEIGLGKIEDYIK